MLGDENKRILYDAGGMDMVKQGVDDGQQQQHDPFAALFGGGRQQRTNRGPDAAVGAAKRRVWRGWGAGGLCWGSCKASWGAATVDGGFGPFAP